LTIEWGWSVRKHAQLRKPESIAPEYDIAHPASRRVLTGEQN
jgi:hypothetical protein